MHKLDVQEVHFISTNSGASKGGGVTVLQNLLAWDWPIPVHLHYPQSADRLWARFAREAVSNHSHPGWRVWEYRQSQGYPAKSEFDFDLIPEKSVVVLDSLEAIRQLCTKLDAKDCKIVYHVNSPDHCLKRNLVHTLRDIEKYRRIDLMIFVSNFVERTFRHDPVARLLLSRVPSRVVYPGIPIPQKAVLATETNIVYFGRYESYKNPLFLADLPGNIAWVGSNAGCTNPVSVPPELDRGWIDDLGKVAELGDLFVFPSVNEAFGLGLVEMMSYGKVPLAFRSGAFPEIVEAGVSGFLVDPMDVPAAKACVAAFEDPKLRRSMSMAARERSEYFSIDRFGRDFYEGLLNL